MSSRRLFVSTRKGLFRLEHDGARWRVASTSFLGDPVTLVLPDARDGAVYAALDHGHFGVKLHRSDDGGETFEEVTAPAYPPPPEGAAPELDPVRQEPIEHKLKLIWALEAGEGRSLWCGTAPGGLFRSDDRGATWTLNRPLWDTPSRKEWFGGGLDNPAIHSVCVDPRDARRVLVAISCGGVWVSEDDGASWEVRTEGMYAAYMPPERANDPAIQDPHRVVRCPANPDVLWTQHHNGAFRSTNGGRSWSELKVPPSSFGFAVAAHPKDPDTAWFVPAEKDERRIPVDGKVVVARTRDGGETFDVLREGLPQEHAYDLTLRHALDVDDSGDVLAFGTTSGSLFVTDDGGDRWEVVSHHLPPIHAVRFG